MDEKKNQGNGSKIMVILAIIILVVVAIVIIVGAGKNGKTENQVLYTEAEGIKTNISEKLSEERMVDTLKLTNISLTYQEGVSSLKADVINETEENTGDFDVDLKILDKNGQEIITLRGYIPPVEAKGTSVLDAAVTTDIVGAYDFEITRVTE